MLENEDGNWADDLPCVEEWIEDEYKDFRDEDASDVPVEYL